MIYVKAFDEEEIGVLSGGGFCNTEVLHVPIGPEDTYLDSDGEWYGASDPHFPILKNGDALTLLAPILDAKKGLYPQEARLGDTEILLCNEKMVVITRKRLE